MTPDEEIELKEAIMRADLNLKRKQAFWETPRNLAIVLGAVVALAATAAGIFGWNFGRDLAKSQQPMFPPGTVITIPPAKP